MDTPRYADMPFEDMLKELTQEERLQLAREHLNGGTDFDLQAAAGNILSKRQPRTLSPEKEASIAANDDWPNAQQRERQRLEGVNRMETAKAVAAATAGQTTEAQEEFAAWDKSREIGKRNLEAAYKGAGYFEEGGSISTPDLKAIGALRRAGGGEVDADYIAKVKDEFASHYDAMFASEEFHQQDKEFQQKAMQHRADMMQALVDAEKGIRLTPEKLTLLEEAGHAYNRFMLGAVRGAAGVGKWVADAFADSGALDQMQGVHGQTAKEDLSSAGRKMAAVAEGAEKAMKTDPSAVESRAAQAETWNLNRAVSQGVSGTLSSAEALVGSVILGPTAGLVATIGLPTFGSTYMDVDADLKRKYPNMPAKHRFALATAEAGVNAAVEIGSEELSDMLGLGVIGGVGMKRPVEAFMGDTTRRGAKKFFGGVARNIKNMALGTFAEWLEEAVADPLEDMAKAYRGESEIAEALKGKDKAANLAGYAMNSWRDALLGVATIPLQGAASAGLQAMQKRNNVSNALSSPEYLKEFGVHSEYVAAQTSQALFRSVAGDRQGAEGIMQILEGMAKDRHNNDISVEDVATARKIFDQVANTAALGSFELLESVSANPLPYNGHARVDVAPVGNGGLNLVTASLDDEVIGMALMPSKEEANALREMAMGRWLGSESMAIKPIDGGRYMAKVDGKWMTFDEYGHKKGEMSKEQSEQVETQIARQLGKLPREYSLADRDGNVGVRVGDTPMMNGRSIGIVEWGRTEDNRPQWMVRGSMDDLDWVRQNARGLEYVANDNDNVLLVAGANPSASILAASDREANIDLGGHQYTLVNLPSAVGREWRVYASSEDLSWLAGQNMRLSWDGKSNMATLYNHDGPKAIRSAIDPNGEMTEKELDIYFPEAEPEWAARLPGHDHTSLVNFLKNLPDGERSAALKFFGDGKTVAFYPGENGQMKTGTRQQCVEESVANGVALRDNGKGGFEFVYRNGVTMPVNKAAYDYAKHLRGESQTPAAEKPDNKTPRQQTAAAPRNQAKPPKKEEQKTNEQPETPAQPVTQTVTAADVVGSELDDLRQEQKDLQAKVDDATATDDDKARLDEVKEEVAELSAVAAEIPAEEQDTVSGKGKIRRLKVSEIKVDPKRFQFKSGTEAATGVERRNELTGEWDEKTAGNLYVWQDKDGNYFVVNGHHRLDLAKRKGVEEINVVVDREADGVTEEQARHTGVMINIRDGQGTVEDYARFIHSNKISEGKAEAEGFFRGRNGGKGRQGWLIGAVASEAVYSAFINGDISADKAAAIAEVGRGEEGLEAAGVRMAATMDAASLQEAMKALKRAPKSKPVQGDLFGFDDSAIRTAEAIGKLVAKRKAALTREIRAGQSAIRRPDLAGNLDVSVGEFSEDKLNQKKAELERLEHYDTDHELYQELLREVTEQQKPAEKPKAEPKPEPKKEEAKPAEQPKAETKPEPKLEQKKEEAKPAEQPATSNEMTQAEIDSIPGTAAEKKKVVEYLNSLPKDERADAKKWLVVQAKKSGQPRYKWIEWMLDNGYTLIPERTSFVKGTDSRRVNKELFDYGKWLVDRSNKTAEAAKPTEQPKQEVEAKQGEAIDRASYKEYQLSLPPNERTTSNRHLLSPFREYTTGHAYVEQKIADGFTPYERNGNYYLMKGDESYAVPQELHDYGKWLQQKSSKEPLHKEIAKQYLNKLKSGGKVVMTMPSDKTYRQEIYLHPKGLEDRPYEALELENNVAVAVHSLKETTAERIISDCLDDGWTIYHTTENPNKEKAEEAKSDNFSPFEEEQQQTEKPKEQTPGNWKDELAQVIKKPWLTEDEIRNSGEDQQVITQALAFIHGRDGNMLHQFSYYKVKKRLDEQAAQSKAEKQETPAATPAAEATEKPKDDIDALIDEGMDELKDLAKQWSQANRRLNMNAPMDQMLILARMGGVCAKIGYGYVVKGVREFKAWTKAMSDKLRGMLSENGMSDDDIDRLIADAWETDYTVGDKTMTVKEWAESFEPKPTKPEAEQPKQEEQPKQDEQPKQEKIEVQKENYQLPENEAPTTEEGRIKANVLAIRTLKEVERRGIGATEEEKERMSNFTGWGGLGSVFSEGNRHYQEVRDIMTDEEYNNARATTIDAFYTSRSIARRMWNIAMLVGSQNEKVGELGAGVGTFLGTRLNQHTKFHAVELDSISARMLTAIYPEAKVTNAGLEQTRIADSSLDLVIGNFPFGNYKLHDQSGHSYPPMSIHNYFFARAIDAVKPGGFVIALTSRFTLDSADTAAREWLQERADMVAAIRLPNNAFSGTNVVTDIIVLRKHTDNAKSTTNPYTELKPVETGDNTGPAQVNEYFAAHPDMVLGTMSNAGSGRFGATFTVVPKTDETLDAQLKKVLTKLLVKRVMTPQSDAAAEETAEASNGIDSEDRREGEIFLNDGKVYHVVNGKGVLLPGTVDGRKPLTEKKQQMVESFLELSEIYDTVLDSMVKGEDDATLASKQKLLNNAYDSHVKRFGVLSGTSHAILRGDPRYYRVQGLENMREVETTGRDGRKIIRREYIKSDVFTKRTVVAFQEPETAKDIDEALKYSREYRAGFNLEYVAGLLGRDAEDVAKELSGRDDFFINPQNGVLEPADKYLTGNVVKKLHEAEEAAASNPDYDKNVKALTAVRPARKNISEIGTLLGASWIPAEVYNGFFKDEYGADMTWYYDKGSSADTFAGSGQWVLLRYGAIPHTINVGGYGLDYIAKRAMLMGEPTIYRDELDAVGRTKRVKDPERTQEAIQIKDEMLRRFDAYVRRNANMAKLVEDEYNEKINTHVDRKYEGIENEYYPGAAHEINGRVFKLRDYQRRGVARAMEGNVLFDHCVGAGKTALMITAAMELKRLGKARKSMIVVQNATIEQFGSFARQLYPTGKILAVTKKDFEGSKRKWMFARIASGDWDVVIIPSSQFKMIDDSQEDVNAIFTSFENAAREAAEEARKNGGRTTVADVERQVRAIRQKLAKKLERKLDGVLAFSELGIDALFVDEAHEYKKNFFLTTMGNVKGLDKSCSTAALSLFVKMQGLRRRLGGERNCFLATGTPISNTLTELWNMVRFLSPNTLNEFGVNTFDQFASTFTRTTSALEIDAAGRARMVSRFSEYQNLEELGRLWKNVSDVVLSRDLKDVKRPPIKGGKIALSLVPRSGTMDKVMNYFKALYEWYEAQPAQVRRRTPIPLLIFGAAKKATVDLRLMNPNLPDDPGSKVNKCCEAIMRVYKETDEYSGAQVVFCDSKDCWQTVVEDGKARRVSVFNVFNEMKRKLVDAGIPEEKIAVIDDYDNDKKRAEVFEKVNKGTVRVIMGSTGKLGVGVNMQERLAAAHHLDAPYRPMDLEQRNGRIIRQGNTVSPVEILCYAVEKTLDAGAYQMLRRKQAFNEQARIGEITSGEDEDAESSKSYAEFAAEISGDPRAMRLVELQKKIQDLESMKRTYDEARDRLPNEIDHAEHFIDLAEKTITTLETFGHEHENLSWDNFTWTIGDATFTGKRADAARALDPVLQTQLDRRLQSVHGEINGLKVTFRVDSVRDATTGEITYKQLFSLDDLAGVSNLFNIRRGAEVNNAQGFFTVLDHIVTALPEKIGELQNRIKSHRDDIARMKDELDKPFEKRDELDAAYQEELQLRTELTSAGGEQRWTGDRPTLGDFLEGAEFDTNIEMATDDDAEGSETEVVDDRESDDDADAASYRATDDYDYGDVDDDEIGDVIAKFRKIYKCKLELATEDDLPDDVRERLDTDRWNDKIDNWKGMYYNGVCYINYDAIASIEDLVTTIMHEAGTHYGLRCLFPDREAFSKFLLAVEKMEPINAKVGEYLKAGKVHVAAIEEAIAWYAEKYNDAPLWKRICMLIYDAARKLLAKLGISAEPDTTQIREVIREANKAAQRGSISEGWTLENLGAMMAKPADAPLYKASNLEGTTKGGVVRWQIRRDDGTVVDLAMDNKKRQYINRVKQLFKKYVSWGKNRGGVDASINEAMFKATSEIAAQNEDHRRVVLQVVSTAKAFYKEPWAGEVHEAVERLWNNEFGVDTLHENMPHYDDPRVMAHVETVLEARESIDKLSRMVEGIAKISPYVRKAIEDNLGSYHFRAYRIHRDGKYQPSDAVRQKAVAAVASELMDVVKAAEATANTIVSQYVDPIKQNALCMYLRTGDDRILDGKSKRFKARARILRRLLDRTMTSLNNGLEVLTRGGLVTFNADQQKVNGISNAIVQRLLDKNSDMRHMGIGGAAWKIIQGSFIRRKDLPQWLRSLYGEITDIGMQFEMTARRLTAIVVTDQMYRTLKNYNDGLSMEDKNRSFYPREYTRDGVFYNKQLEGPKFGALEGMFTDQNTYDLLTGFEREDGKIGKIWKAVVAFNRYMHTVMNPPTHLRNFLGNLAFAMNDGEFWRINSYRKAMYKAFKTLLTNSQEASAERQRLMRLGLIGSSAHGVEIFQTISALNLQSSDFEPNELLSLTGRFMKAWKWITKKAANAYAIEDNVFRVAAFYAKEARGESAQEAVDRIRDLYTTYEMAPIATGILGHNIPTGKDFMTFQAEAVRCYLNAFKYMVKDWKQGSPYSTIGMLGVLALAMPMVQTFIGGIFGRDDDEEEDARLSQEEFKAMRILLPEYMKDHAIIPWKAGKKFVYYDLGYIYPFDFLPAAFSMATSNESFSVRMKDLAQDSVFGTLFGGMTSNMLAEQIIGREGRSGRKLGFKGRVEQAITGFTPSSWHYGARMIKLLTAEEDQLVTKSGEIQTWKEEGAKIIIPIREFRKDMATSYLYKMRSEAEEVRTWKTRANQAWRRAASHEGTRADAEAAQRDAQAMFDGEIRERLRLLDEAGAKFLDRKQRGKLLRDAGFSLKDTMDILNNKPIRYTRPQ